MAKIFNLIVCLCLINSVVFLNARRCLQCNSVTQPLDCSHVSECGRNEECYFEKYVTTGGIIVYDVGCKDTKLCTSSHEPFGKRRSIGTSICSACCNDKDVCNIDGHCSAEKFLPPLGSNLCYKCHLSGRPDSCHQLTLCDQHSVCSLQQVTNYLGHIRWEHGCVKKAVCSSLSNHGGCSYCCDSPLCNYNCSTTHSVITSPSLLSTSTAIQQTIPIVIQTVIRPTNIKYGETVTVQCLVTGNPKPTIDFLVKGKRLGSNVQVDPTTHVLTISNFLPYNDGDYRCVAANLLGDNHKDIHLQGQH